MGLSTVFGMRFRRIARNLGRGAAVAVFAGFLIGGGTHATANPKYAGIVVDAKTGKTLYADNADAYRFPASLTKIMTLYVVFEELEAGRLTLNSRLKVSKYAAGRPPSKIGLKPGSTIKVKDAILALVTKSANDVATVVAENIGGSEAAFARRMTRTARQLGMSKTTFRNAHGLPNSKQRTTARDMARLGRAIEERFPEEFKYFNTRVFTYKGRRYGNHNKLLGRVKGVDGIKTGYIRASGFNLVTSVKRNGRHVVAVVMGGRTGASRNAHMKDLIGRYLHKASRGPKTAPVIASRGLRKRFNAAALSNVPTPQQKPGSAVETVVARAPEKPIPAETQVTAPAEAQVTAASPAPGAPETVLALAPVKPATADMSAAFTGSIPVPPKLVRSRFDGAFEAAGLPPVRPPKPIAAPVETAAANVPVTGTPLEAGSADEDDTDSVVTVATSDTQEQEPTWQIQIAATETENDAIGMLKRATEATGSALRKRVPYTEPVEADGQTLYRARFVGFETKTAAWNACRTLKRKRFACFAIYQ